jgi:hypothetical protein
MAAVFSAFPTQNVGLLQLLFPYYSQKPFLGIMVLRLIAEVSYFMGFVGRGGGI